MHGHHTKSHYVADFSSSWHPPSLYEPTPLALHTTHKKDTRVESSNDPTATYITSKDDEKHVIDPYLPSQACCQMSQTLSILVEYVRFLEGVTLRRCVARRF